MREFQKIHQIQFLVGGQSKAQTHILITKLVLLPLLCRTQLYSTPKDILLAPFQCEQQSGSSELWS